MSELDRARGRSKEREDRRRSREEGRKRGGRSGGNARDRSEEGIVFLEACWLTEADAKHNAALRPADEVKAGNEAMVEKISVSYRPLLRPNAEYLIEIQTTDTVDGNAKAARTHAIAFRTAGPVGHFHEFPTKTGPKKHPKWKKNQFALEKLTTYVDMKRSYPAADGNLVGAKPLYFTDPDLRLYFNEPYVERFFTNWRPVGSLPKLDSSLELEILDPAINPNPPNWEDDPSAAPTAAVGMITATNMNAVMAVGTGSVASREGKLAPIGAERADGILRAAVRNLSFEADPLPTIPRDVQLLANMIEHGPDCGGDLDSPTDIPASFVKIEAENLRPRALYTASWRAVFEGEAREVHQYQFQTSRYADQTEHVHSYATLPALEPELPKETTEVEAARSDTGISESATDDDGMTVIDIAQSTPDTVVPPPAVRPEPRVFVHVPEKEIDTAGIAAVAAGTVDDEVRRQFATAYDQLHESILELRSMPASVGTDFTAVVKEIGSVSKEAELADGATALEATAATSEFTTSGEPEVEHETYAVLIRSPEPFIDPRLPAEQVVRTVTAKGLVSIVAPDAARAFLVRADGRRIDGGEHKLVFEHWCFGSAGVELIGTETVTITVPGEPPPEPAVSQAIAATVLLDPVKIAQLHAMTDTSDDADGDEGGSDGAG